MWYFFASRHLLDAITLKLNWSAKIFHIAHAYVMANKIEGTDKIQNYKYRDWLWLSCQQLCFDSQIPIHNLVSKHRCLLHTETVEWVIFADTTKGNSCPLFPNL